MFACGYNGFQQIFKFADKSDVSTNPLENIQFYNKPIQLKLTEDAIDKQQVIITWPKIHFSHKSEKPHTVLGATWKHTLCRNATQDLYIDTDKGHLDVLTDVDIQHIRGSEDTFYSIHDNGQLSELKVEEILQDESTIMPSTSCRLIPRPVFTSSVVTSLSCGKEHVLFLTVSSQVFSFGLGSRGQLGHGSVEEERTPRGIEVLDGVGVVQVDAGGWHSAAVTATGDVFTWGWNESGQLGHPSGNAFPISSSLEKERPSHPQKADSETPEHSVSRNKEPGVSGDQKSQETNVLIYESSKTDLKFGSTGSTVPNLNKTGSDKHNVQDRHGDQGTIVPKSDKPSNLKTETIDSSVLTNQNTSEGGQVLSGNSSSNIVDDEVITLQSCPLLVTSLPEDYRAVRVSCGSRHTAVLTDDGKLFTTGWNKYGQLGQGHTQTKDRFGVVDVGNSAIEDVVCGWWNTIIFSKVT